MKNKLDIKKEIIGGIISFITMLYLIPTLASMAIDANVSYSAAFVMYGMISSVSTIIISFICKVPFIVSSGLGLTSYIIYTVISSLGFSYSEALVMVFISNILFLLLSIFKIRFKIINKIPLGIKNFISISLGAFLMVVGIKSTGIIKYISPFVFGFGGFNITIFLGLIGIIIGILLFIFEKTRRYAIPSSIILITLLSIILGLFNVEGVPSFNFETIELSESINLLKSIWSGFNVLSDFRCYFIILIILIMNMVESTASIFMLSSKLNKVDEEGNIIDGDKLGVVDSSIGVVSSVLGSLPICILCESDAGINYGATSWISGLTSGLLLFFLIFFYPIFSIFAPVNGLLPITSSAIFLIGLTVFLNIKEANFKDLTTSISGIIMIVITILSYNLSYGIGVGLFLFCLLSLIFKKKINLSTIIISIIFFSGLLIQILLF